MTPARDGKRPWIHLVEDDAHDIELFHRALADLDDPPAVRVSRSGADALATLRRASEPGSVDGLPRVVILDLKLPGMRGVEVLRALRDEPETRWVPVVVFTSSRERRDVADAYVAGANSYAVKPIHFGEVRALVASLVRYWVDVNEPPAIPD